MGDPFAGMIYFYGTLTLFDGKNEQDVSFDKTAAAVPVPADGKVRRILDNGTGPGQLATSLKRRFPEAEVWGIDVSGPMVRYAHHRANQMGLNVNFANRLAEDNGFPDNYFDIVVSTSFHHELTAEASKKVFTEAQRTLRKGGVYRPADSGINGYPQTPLEKVHTYLAWRQNHEVWMMEWADLDRLGAIKASGLKLDADGAAGGDGSPWLKTINVVARKA
jgi:ubiquinone/menaquinone biosynthesis C-methylase UbiE